ncbi:NAD(P)-binding domain-containing protein [Arthrobacter sp. UYCu723]
MELSALCCRQIKVARFRGRDFHCPALVGNRTFGVSVDLFRTALVRGLICNTRSRPPTPRRIAAPVLLGTEATRIARAGGRFSLDTAGGRFTAENVVLANGAFQRPRIPAASAGLPGHVQQLHSHDYRNPQQLPDAAVLVVGAGQSGGQITEDLLDAAARSICPFPRARRRPAGTAATTPQDERRGYRVIAASPVSDSISVSVVSAGTRRRSSIP